MLQRADRRGDIGKGRRLPRSGTEVMDQRIFNVPAMIDQQADTAV